MIRLYNTLSKRVEEFTPMETGVVRMFVCGPTVYDFSHLGHAKTYVQFDVVARSLRYLGYQVTYLQNITDIDDKIIVRALERGVSPSALALEFEKYYLEDMAILNVTSVDRYERATDYIKEIVSQVKRLIEKGAVYKISDGYYFDIKSFADYGKLSGRTLSTPGDAISRIDENPEKKNPGDFCVWKFKKDDEPSWPTELGEGRPGWHIEDTAITEKVFGPQYDLHGGAIDLIFPHHEAEITQMETISGQKPFVKYWLHTGFLNTKSEKMSKSLGNSLTIRELSKEVNPLALRYFFLGAHYRTPISYTEEALEGAENAYRRLKVLMKMFKEKSAGAGKVNEKYKQEFVEALENDLNTPEALAVVWKLAKNAGDDIAYEDAYATLLDFDSVLGLRLDNNEYEILDVPEEVQKLLNARETARKEKDFEKSDELREKIKKLGFGVKDTETGQTLSKI
ncbi:cysteine--tRNA ligase [Candidatus Parcubacteria bacterium]|nr:cysteine--tRNA ligase [Candidatus Parcubacteria bacterium]